MKIKTKVNKIWGLAIVLKNDTSVLAEGINGIVVSTDPYKLMENYMKQKKIYKNITIRKCTVVL